MKFLDTEIAPLGMGCWPIGGPMFSGDQTLGYSNTDDEQSIQTIHAALDGGIRLFDTAAAYGVGHAERLLARALKARHQALIVTKIGFSLDEKNKQITFEQTDPVSVIPAIDACLKRLERDQIDILLFHHNDFPIDQANLVFDEMDKALQAGKIRGYGWSTDFSANTKTMASRDGFVAIEHAMNVLFDAQKIQQTAKQQGLLTLIRSPLAMGLLTGKYGSKTKLPDTDIRSTSRTDYFQNATANPELLAQFEAVRELLKLGGRTLTQGALCWLWAKSETSIAIPGARTVAQIKDICGALDFGPLSENIMEQIETLIEREPANTPQRER